MRMRLPRFARNDVVEGAGNNVVEGAGNSVVEGLTMTGKIMLAGYAVDCKSGGKLWLMQ